MRRRGARAAGGDQGRPWPARGARAAGCGVGARSARTAPMRKQSFLERRGCSWTRPRRRGADARRGGRHLCGGLRVGSRRCGGPRGQRRTSAISCRAQPRPAEPGPGPFRFAELFAGLGGFAALEALGARGGDPLEIDPHACIRPTRRTSATCRTATSRRSTPTTCPPRRADGSVFYLPAVLRRGRRRGLQRGPFVLRGDTDPRGEAASVALLENVEGLDGAALRVVVGGVGAGRVPCGAPRRRRARAVAAAACAALRRRPGPRRRGGRRSSGRAASRRATAARPRTPRSAGDVCADGLVG